MTLRNSELENFDRKHHSINYMNNVYRSFPLQFKEDNENIEAKLVKIYSASHTHTKKALQLQVNGAF